MQAIFHSKYSISLALFHTKHFLPKMKQNISQYLYGGRPPLLLPPKKENKKEKRGVQIKNYSLNVYYINIFLFIKMI